MKIKTTEKAYLNASLLKPITNFLFLNFGPPPRSLLDLGIHNGNIVAKVTLCAVSGAIELLIGFTNLLLRLKRWLINSSRWHEPLGLLGRFEYEFFFWVGLLEEGGVNVVLIGGAFGGERESIRFGVG